jgi:hypothetical protein
MIKIFSILLIHCRDYIPAYKITELETYDNTGVYYGEYSENALMVNGMYA